MDRNSLSRLPGVMSALRNSDATVKADLAAYFSVLREFGDRYEALRRRAARDLEKLNLRSTAPYDFERTDELAKAKRKGETDFIIAQGEYPERVYYGGYAKEMRLC